MKCRECSAPPAMKIKVTRLDDPTAVPFTIFACQKHLPTVLAGMSVAAKLAERTLAAIEGGAEEFTQPRDVEDVD